MAGFLRTDSARLGTVNNVAVATTSTAAASSAFGAQTYQIRVAASAVCYMKMGDPAATPTAAVTDAMLPPNWIEYVTVTPGQKVSFFSPTIQTISVVEISQ
jgi:hypothetical protein